MIITISAIPIVTIGDVYTSPIKAVQATNEIMGLPISKAENKPDN